MALNSAACRVWGVAVALVPVLSVLCASEAVAGTARILKRPDLGVTIIHFEGGIAKGDLARIREGAVTRTKCAARTEDIRLVLRLPPSHSPTGAQPRL